jgi:hypothetical protein
VPRIRLEGNRCTTASLPLQRAPLWEVEAWKGVVAALGCLVEHRGQPDAGSGELQSDVLLRLGRGRGVEVLQRAAKGSGGYLLFASASMRISIFGPKRNWIAFFI